MPNYFIQAQTGHFNPMSFDDMVKPLNMYKQYYEQNEEKLTELQAQAKLWEDIANSELDAEYADKYNNYAQSLDDAAQQLSNGMSYNLRKQVQDLRAQSAMVSQIENAYALRAKDIDAYNKMMYEDPSRIGATNPRNIRLNEYFGGPIQMNYGVSGDRLNKLGALQSYNMADTSAIETELSIVDQLQTNGQDINSIMNFLEDNNSMVYKMAENIMAGDNMPFQKGTTEYNEALLQTINGIASGVQQKNMELAKLASKGKSSSGDFASEGNYDSSFTSNIGWSNDVSYDEKSYAGSIINDAKNNESKNYYAGENGKLVSDKLIQLQQNPNSNPAEILKEQDRLDGINKNLLEYGVPGNTEYERYENFVNFYGNASQMDNKAILPTNSPELMNKLNTVYKTVYSNSISSLKYFDEDGDIQEVENSKEIKDIKDNGSFRFTTNGCAIERNGKYYYIVSDNDKINEFDNSIQALNKNLLTIDGQNELYNACKDNVAKLGNTNIYCKSEGDNFYFQRSIGNGNFENLGYIKRFDAVAAMDFLLKAAYYAGFNDIHK